MRSMRTRRHSPGLLPFLAVLWMAWNACAHQPGLSYLSLAPEPTTLKGRLDVALRDIELSIGLDEDNNGSVTYEELLHRQPAIGEYMLKNLHLRADEADLPLKIDEHKVASDQDGVYAVVEFSAAWDKIPRKLEVSCRLFSEVDPNHRTLSQLEFEGNTSTAVFRLDDPIQSFELRKPSKGEQFGQFLREGVWHIWTGYDHMLFLLALLLPAVLHRNGPRWEGVNRLRPAMINVLKVVTAFTVAHSITLSLAVFGLISLPTRLVESTIAASVVLAAANNIYPMFRDDRTWLVAFCFGIIHGFGFASVLGMLKLPANALALALVSFNVGVETGQLVIVAAFLPLAFALRSKPLYRRDIMWWGSAFIVVVAYVWMVLRLTAPN